MARKLIGAEDWVACVTCGCVTITDKNQNDGELFRSTMKNRQMKSGVFVAPKGTKVTGKPSDAAKKLVRGMDAPGSRSKVLALQEGSNDFQIHRDGFPKSPEEKQQERNAFNFLEAGISDSFKMLDGIFQIGTNIEEPDISKELPVPRKGSRGRLDENSTQDAALLERQNAQQRLPAALHARRQALRQDSESLAKEKFPGDASSQAQSGSGSQLNSPRSTKQMDRKPSAAGTSSSGSAGDSRRSSVREAHGEPAAQDSKSRPFAPHPENLLHNDSLASFRSSKKKEAHGEFQKGGIFASASKTQHDSGLSKSSTGSLLSSTATLLSPRKSMQNLRDKIASFGSTSNKHAKKVGDDPVPPQKEHHYEGEEAVVLHNYTAEEGAPFPPDPRTEITTFKGRKMDILEMREDGWCLVRKPTGTKEYWMPGNYLSTDGGKTPYYEFGDACKPA